MISGCVLAMKIPTRRFIALLLAACLPGLAGASSRVEPWEDPGYGTCGGFSFYGRRSDITMSNSVGSAQFRPRLKVEIYNPLTAEGTAETRIEMRASVLDIVSSVNQLLKLMESSGCDRLHYNNDAAITTYDDKWVITSHFTYEERVCTGVGSATIATRTQPLHIDIVPDFALREDAGKPVMTMRLVAGYRLPLFLNVTLEKDLFNIDETYDALPAPIAANITGSEMVLKTLGGKTLQLEAAISLRPLKKSIACLIKEGIGEEIWKSGDWYRHH